MLGISQSAYSQIEKGTVSLSLEYLKLLCKEYNVSMDWVSMGEGPKQQPAMEGLYIPMVNKAAKAGYLENIGNKDYLNELGLYRIPGFTEGTYRIFEVAGESMKPSLLPNDHLICSAVEDIKEVVDGSICVLVTADKIVVKRVNFQNKERTVITLTSENPEYRPYSVAANDIKESWLVNAKLTTSLISNGHEQSARIERLEEGFKEVKDQLQLLLETLNSK